MNTMIYLGISPNVREIFHATEIPTHQSHGAIYSYAIGPFDTIAGAEFMRDYGQSNPHCRCVAEAERLAKVHAKTHN